MVNGKKVVVVMPAFNAERTLMRTYNEVIDQGCVDEIIIVDDHSRDETVAIASQLCRAKLFRHAHNLGYGGNQKSCYRLALEEGCDIAVMVHPDHQYTPKLIPSMVHLIASGLYHCVLGSRMLGGHAIDGGMPLWKYTGNRALTALQNLLLGARLSEYHTGYRAFSRHLLQRLRWQNFSDGFLFDNQFLAQTLWHKYRIAEVTCPTKYSPEVSSINLAQSVRYGLGCLVISLQFRLARMRLSSPTLFL